MFRTGYKRAVSMQNFADYYSTMLARKLFKESREQAVTVKKQPSPEEYHIPVQHQQEDLLDYEIFFNPGSGHHSAQEVKGRDKAFVRRWLSFYTPDAGALPHHDHLKQLERHKSLLTREHAQLVAPRLVALLVCAILAVLLSVRDSSLLLLIPLALFVFVWFKTSAEVNRSSQQLKKNRSLRVQQNYLLAELTEKAQQRYPVESLDHFQENYTVCLERFLRSSIHDLRPELKEHAIKDQLLSGEMQVFMLESRGILQVPDVCQQSGERLVALEALVRQSGSGWCALHPSPELEGMTRLHYVFCAIAMEQGVILCNAYYDWVGDEIHAAQSEYYGWQHIAGVRSHEVHFPADNALKDDLSNAVYELHFGEPVQVFSVRIRNGEQQYCALPLHRSLRQTVQPNLPGMLLVRHLKRDLPRLNSMLSARSHSLKTHAAGAATTDRSKPAV